MFPTPAKPINALAAAQKAVTAEHEAGVLAMKQAVGGDESVPDNLSAAAVLVARLMREKKEADRKISEQADLLLKAEQERLAQGKYFDNGLRAIIEGEPELEIGDPLAAVRHCLERLRQSAKEAIADQAKARESVAAAMSHMGMVAVPGVENLFIGVSPVLACAEASAVQLFGNREAKEAYLRRRGWIFTGNTGWRDSLLTGNFPFDSAVTVQAKRDIAPFRGLGSREWKGIARNEVKFAPMTKEDKATFAEAAKRGESVSALASV